jgi:hypothetical protein
MVTKIEYQKYIQGLLHRLQLIKTKKKPYKERKRKQQLEASPTPQALPGGTPA